MYLYCIIYNTPVLLLVLLPYPAQHVIANTITYRPRSHVRRGGAPAHPYAHPYKYHKKCAPESAPVYELLLLSVEHRLGQM